MSMNGQAMHTIDHLQIQSVIAECEEGKSNVESNMTFEKRSNVLDLSKINF